MKLPAFLFAASVLLAQPSSPPSINFVTSDPAGACSLTVPLRFNTTNAKLWGCSGLTWTQIGGGGGGTTIGGAVTGGTANYNLIVDGSSNLGQEQYLGAARFPALTGDVTTTAGSLATAIGAGKVTNAMLAGSLTAGNFVGTGIATVGTITAGTWHGTVVSGLYGGTGTNNGSNTITLGNNLTTSGNFALTLTTTGTTNVTLPTTGTLATTAGNVATATALAANGTNCSAGNYPLGGDASGNAESCTAAATGTVTSIATTSPITGGTITGTGTIACATCGVTGTGLNQFAATTSAQLAGVLSDETGSGLAVFGTSPTLTTPAITTSATLSNNNILAVSTDGLVLQNTTASDGTNTAQWSPRLHFIGQGWKSNSTTANHQTEWIVENQPLSNSTAPDNSLAFTPIRNGTAGKAVYFCQANTGTPRIGVFGLDGGNIVRCDNSVSFTGIGDVNTSNISAVWNNASQTENFGINGIIMASSKSLMWAASTISTDATGDVGLCRDAAGIVSVYNGT